MNLELQNLGGASLPVTRQQIIQFEKLMERGEKITLELKHYFANGVYARELFIPKGVILTGKIHKFSHLSILTKGVMDILIDNKMRTVKAPYMFVAPAGTKRILRALEDSIRITIHENITNETDVDKLEEYYVACTEDEYLEYLKKEPLLPFRELQC
jgi:hypothetical protein